MLSIGFDLLFLGEMVELCMNVIIECCLRFLLVVFYVGCCNFLTCRLHPEGAINISVVELLFSMSIIYP